MSQGCLLKILHSDSALSTCFSSCSLLDIFRMIILEDDLEKLMVSKEPRNLTVEGYQDLSDRLHQLQPHMQASTGCWEDTMNQVERMLRRANACPGEPARLQTHSTPIIPQC